jgi:TM2 domain-containing membrane protein YozV
MTQTPDPDEPGTDDTAPLAPGPPPAPHGDPIAPPAPQQGGWQPQYQEQYPAPQQPPQPPGPQGYPQAGYPQAGYPQPGYAPPGYPQPQPGAPYGIHPGTGIPYSEKSKLVAGLLQIFVAGVGRMYMGHVGLGIAQLCVAIFTCGVGVIWSFIDGILILTKDDPRDAQGRILKP